MMRVTQSEPNRKKKCQRAVQNPQAVLSFFESQASKVITRIKQYTNVCEQ